MFYNYGYDDNIEPYDIDTDIDTILINATQAQVSHIPFWKDVLMTLQISQPHPPEDAIQIPFCIHAIERVCAM
jgi:hypothetical protein